MADKSVQRILLIAAGVLGLFGIYFLLAMLSNRSVRQTAEILRRRREGRPIDIDIRPTTGVLTSWPLAVAILILSAAGLVTLLVYSTTALR